MRIGVIAIAVTVLATGCGADDPTAEPGLGDTVAPARGGDGSVLQATVAEGADGDGGDDGEGDGDATTTGTDHCGSAEPTEIRFQRGATSATVDAAASAGQRDRYSVEVGSGQIMTVAVESSDATARATIRAPTTDRPSTEFVERTIVPTRAGRYEICVIAGPGGADYELLVSVVDDDSPVRADAAWCGDTVNDRGPIRFDRGAFADTVDGGIVLGERDLYTIEAAAGQNIDLFLVSVEDNTVFDLRAPSGELLVDGVSDFRIPLPEDGVYQICIGSVRGNASYELTVSIA